MPGYVGTASRQNSFLMGSVLASRSRRLEMHDFLDTYLLRNIEVEWVVYNDHEI
jgi:hypothetical protein